ncbi:methionine gamma-lyase family protein [Enterococcus timonensis]|uniref:methionine gamma-lyase family protein n=1 Tax=Enterococcus timonensis TaxID=1852364 RepID=UPI0008D9DB8F|nr:methionine gamma-lyase family protein [Enterococcus timonensis]
MNWNKNFSKELQEKINEAQVKIALQIESLENIALENQAKVLQAFNHAQISETHFAPSTGYGYDDLGRDALEKVYAEVFGAEKAMVRPQIISGTHAISTALFGVLRPGDKLLYLTGTPYDTLMEVIGLTGSGIGSLKEWGITYDQVDLLENGEVDFTQLAEKLTPDVKVVALQRSCGYADRASFTIERMAEMVKKIRELSQSVIIFADNCYGEFSEVLEPTDVGVDLMAGSLIKNPGGGIAKTGGYIAGRSDLVEMCGYRLTTPGVGLETGAMLDTVPTMLQGFFLAPHTVSQAIKGAVFTAALLDLHGVVTSPRWDEPRTDLIQRIALNEKEAMITFCQEIQKYSPVDANVLPIPSEMPGYDDQIIMAAGTFIQGASIELSSDGPIRPPYILYLQGGLTYEHVKLAVCQAVNEVYYQ